MEFFRTNTRIPFMKQRKIAALFSLFIFIASLAALFSRGLNLGLDFTGGNQIVVAYQHAVNPNAVRRILHANNFHEAEVQAYSSREISVRIGVYKHLSQAMIKAHLMGLLPGAKIQSFDYIGPTIGKQLLTNGVLAILVSLLATMAYIAIRFEYRFALSAAIALIHDPVLILGVFAYFHLPFDMIVLTAVLTVIGYSLNDTIVVYDRVRENFRKVRRKTPEYVMDVSINQTLSRTIMTSGLTLLVVIALFLYGGASVHGFSLALMVGILIGTYSSIYVAGSLAIAFGLNARNLLPRERATD